MSPEQAVGERDIDARSDIYSLACVLYEMLAGETPYIGATAQAILAKKLSEPVPQISLLREAVPATVDHALSKALSKTPADRFTTAKAFADTLAAEPEAVQLASVGRLRRRRRWRRAGLAALGLAAVAVAALLTIQSRGPRQDLNPAAIAVLPFTAPGGNERLQELTQQLPAAFWTVLDGRYGPQVSDLGLVHSKWRRAGGTAAQPLPEDAALRIAEELRAGKLVVGTVTGTEEQLTLAATLLEVPSGRPRVRRTTVSGSLAEFATLVDQLIVQLLADDYGEIAERLPRLAAHPNAAVLAYLAGNHLEALALDSSFVLAALQAYRLPPLWENDQAMAQFVWDRRDQLGPRDRAYFEALAGWRFGATPDVVTWVAQFDSARALAPDGWAVRIDLLDKLIQFGPSTDLDWAGRAHAVLRELYQIDSLRVRCNRYEGFLAAVELDTAAFRGYMDACAQARGHPSLAEARGWVSAVVARWTLAHLANDSVAIGKSRAELEALPDTALAGFGWRMLSYGPRLHGRGVEDVERTLSREPGASHWSVIWARWRGRHREFSDDAEAHFRTRWSDAPLSNTAARVGAALFLDLPIDSALRSAADTLRQVASGAIDAGTVPNDPAAETGFRTMAVCWSTLWQLLQEGDTRGARTAVDYLRGAAELPHRWASCAGLIELFAAQHQKADVHAALLRLDSLMRRGPDPAPFSGGLVLPDGIANLVLARELVQYGDTSAAVAAAGRQPHPFGLYSTLLRPEFLQQTSRLLALTGDTTGAIEVYNLHLSLRDRPSDFEPWQKQREKVQAELAALTTR